MRARLARRSPWPFVPQEPTPRQAEFLSLDCLEALYGGAAAGGKSSALLMAALQYVHVPGYAALLLRRTYADLALPGALMSRSHEWLQGTGAVWNERDRRWTFPSGATLTFGYCETAKDVYRYQGAEFQFIGIDELTQWPEQSYRYLLSRLRRLQGVAIPLRARAGANPGGIGHEWVKRRFIDGGNDECRFVGAKLQDNPHVDAVEYRRSLALLTETTRRQLEEGIWVRDSGGLVYRYDEPRNVVEVAPRLDFHVLGIDYGYTDDTAFSVAGWRANDPIVYVVESFKQKGLTPSDAAETVYALSRRYLPVRIVGDMGGLGKGYAEEARARWNLPIEPADKNNKRGYIELMNGDFERSRIKLVSSMTQPLVKEYAELPWEEDRSKECDGFDNHCSDATLYTWRAACAYHERLPERAPSNDELVRAEEAAQIEQAERGLTNEHRWWEQ